MGAAVRVVAFGATAFGDLRRAEMVAFGANRDIHKGIYRRCEIFAARPTAIYPLLSVPVEMGAAGRENRYRAAAGVGDYRGAAWSFPTSPH